MMLDVVIISSSFWTKGYYDCGVGSYERDFVLTKLNDAGGVMTLSATRGRHNTVK